MTALQMFEQGHLDWLGGPLSPLPPDALEKWADSLQFLPSAATTFISFNIQKPPFNNFHLRQALSLSIDREALVQQVAGAGQLVAKSFLPPTLTQQELIPSTNYADAKAHLGKAFQELGIQAKDLDTLTLYFKSIQVDKRLAQALQRQWEQILGIRVRLEQLDAKSLTQKLQNRDYQIALSLWIAQFDDPVSILERFKDPTNLKNFPGWENLEYSQLLTSAATSEMRAQILQQAEALLAKELPLAPLYHWRSPALYGPRIKSIGTTPSGGVLFERCELQK